ncbi:hypothetical protein [Chromobacterium sp. IIBBL 290-4]|uniref:hypothetical protein n=1 Tax=Chromobacterium sp. IIBBL 290-4 TaxID=2953890 RepID=UPI0020B89EFC|nr:hypothetical protein [Chromobacterium sp. IIBBL 290-4]UTH76349.1 hypothetical protein NKT35_09690 [Chromobacterium sp. IIBBL 290-4]
MNAFIRAADTPLHIATARHAPAPLRCAPLRSTLPAALRDRVRTICRLENWRDADRDSWLAMLGRQLNDDGVATADLIAALDAHLYTHHPEHAHADDVEAFEERAAILEYDAGLPRAQAERLAAKHNDCASCRHWRGEATLPDARQRAAMLVGLAPAKLGNATVGICLKRYRPWRMSNIAGEAAYLRWHFIGECAHAVQTETKRNQNRDLISPRAADIKDRKFR